MAKKTVEDVIALYGITLDVDISEMSEDEREALDKDMADIGFRFNRTEGRYDSCLMAVYEK